MNFFCTKEHFFEWTTAMEVNAEDIFQLNAQEGLMVARMLFSI